MTERCDWAACVETLGVRELGEEARQEVEGAQREAAALKLVEEYRGQENSIGKQVEVKVKQSHYRPGGAQRVPGS